MTTVKFYKALHIILLLVTLVFVLTAAGRFTISGYGSTSANSFFNSVAASSSSVMVGGALTVNWAVGVDPSESDWVGLYRVGAPNIDGSEAWWKYTRGVTPGSFQLTAPQQDGKYEFRLFLNDTFTPVATSNKITVEAAPTPTPLPPTTPSTPPSPTSGAQFHVAPQGSPSGNGSLNNPWDLQTAFNHPAAVKAGDTIWLRGGTYTAPRNNDGLSIYTSYLRGAPNAPIIVRQYPGERATIDTNYLWYVFGAHTYYWGFEVTNSEPFRYGHLSHRAGIEVSANNVKFINLIVHDTGDYGYGFFKNAVNCEIYGNLIYYIGTQVDRGRGPAIYTQNETGTKRIVDNIMFQHFAHSMQIYGSDAAYVRNYHIEGNTLFSPGELSSTSDAWNATVWVGDVPAENVSFINNRFYSPTEDGTNTYFPGSSGAVNRNFTFTGNYLIGGASAFRTGKWTPFNFTNNVLFSRYGLVWGYVGDDLTNIAFDNNSYYYEGNRHDVMFQWGYDYLDSFAKWKQATRFDSNSTFTIGRPALNVSVRPNLYEPGRANITVTNMGLQDSAEVDISSIGLSIGQQFEIRDAQNYFGPPVLTGTYNGGPIQLPLSGLTAVSPLVGAGHPSNEGRIRLPVHTRKEFNAFVLLPR